MGGFGGLSEGVEVRHFLDTRQGDSSNKSSLGLGVVMCWLLLFCVPSRWIR